MRENLSLSLSLSLFLCICIYIYDIYIYIYIYTHIKNTYRDNCTRRDRGRLEHMKMSGSTRRYKYSYRDMLQGPKQTH